jgi:hypothetical protein
MVRIPSAGPSVKECGSVLERTQIERSPAFFFGQKPYSPVNVVGEVEGDPAVLSGVADGEAVRVEGA